MACQQTLAEPLADSGVGGLAVIARSQQISDWAYGDLVANLIWALQLQSDLDGCALRSALLVNAAL